MCNANNHWPGCTCGFGGEGHLGRSHTRTIYINPTISLAAPRSTSWREVAATYESYVNTNAHCPVCGDPVIFYQSPYGGRVFFDHPLGWPWPKHPCTDNSGLSSSVTSYRREAVDRVRLETKRLTVTSSKASTRQKTPAWLVQGWNPFVCLYQRSNDNGLVEVWGQILFKNEKGAERSFFIIADTDGPIRDLGDAPIFIKKIDNELGTYELSTFRLTVEPSPLASEIVAISVTLFSGRPMPTKGGIPLCPQCGSQARDLATHIMRLHTRSTIKAPRRIPTPLPKEFCVQPRGRNSRSLRKNSANLKPESQQGSRKGILTNCPICRVAVSRRRLDKHVRSKHGHRI